MTVEPGASKAGSELASALVAARAEMPAVERDGVNPHFRSKFTTIDHLIAKTNPVLNKHGLTILQFPSNINGSPSLRTVLLHSSGESMEDNAPLVLAKDDMQGLGAALTYMRRYAWSGVCGISSEEDDDGNTAVDSGSNILTEDKHHEGGGQVPPSAGGSTISEAQAKRLWAISKESDVDEETLKRLVKEVAGVDSSKEVPRDKYEALVAAVEAHSIPF